jgi:hypothetical protein
VGERNGVYSVLVGKSEGRRPLVGPRHRWEDNIEIGLLEVGWWGLDCIDVAHNTDRWQTRETFGFHEMWRIS